MGDAVYYCSEACAVRNRPSHDAMCPLLPRLRKYELNKKGRGSKGLDRVSHEMFQGLVMLLLGLESLSKESKAALEELQEETCSWNEELRAEYQAVAKCAVSFLHESAGLEVEQLIVEQWLSRMHLNTFELGRNFGALIF